MGLLALFAYAADYVVFRVRVSRKVGYSSVTVRVYYAIQEKNGRPEYVFGSMQDQSCVNSLFGAPGGSVPVGICAGMQTSKFRSD